MINDNRTEKIGLVTLDTTHWHGSELYSDGPIETELLTRIQNDPDFDITNILVNDNRYAMLYHLSRERENILSWFPFTKDTEVLEVGAGCGAITGLLARKCAHVTALDISLTRSRINAWRHRSTENLEILVSNIFDLPIDKKYDVITLIGVLEYGNLFTESASAFDDLLMLMRSHLKPQGRLLIAIENRLGIKYLSGAREDHLWKLYAGLEGYHPKSPTTFTRGELSRLLESNGYNIIEFFYPLPDYKFPHQVFSDYGKEFFSLLHDDFPNYGEYVYEGANQSKVMRSLIQDNLFAELANSFFVVASADSAGPTEIVYAQFASQRDDAYALQTLFRKDSEGLLVIKEPLTSQAEACIENIYNGAQLLAERMHSKNVVNVKREGKSIIMPFIKDRILADALLDICERPKLIKMYYDLVMSLAESEPHDFSEELLFQKVFGDLRTKPMICIKPAPLDLTFNNMLIDRNDDFHIIDTEWVYDMPIPVEYVFWRAAYQIEEKHGIPRSQILKLLEVHDDNIPLFMQMEEAFRKHVYTECSPYHFNEKYQARKLSLARALTFREGPYASILMLKSNNSEENEQIILFDHDREINDQTFSLCERMNEVELRYTPLRGRMCQIRPIHICYDDIDIDPSTLVTNASSYNKETGWNFETYDPYIILPPSPKGTKALRIALKHAIYYDPDVERKMYAYRIKAGERDLFELQLKSAYAELKKVYTDRDELYMNLTEKEAEIEKLYDERDVLQKNGVEKDNKIQELYYQRDELYKNLAAKEAVIAKLYADRDVLHSANVVNDKKNKEIYAQRDMLYNNLSDKEAEIAKLYAEREELQKTGIEKNNKLQDIYAERDELYRNLDIKDKEIERLNAEKEMLMNHLHAKRSILDFTSRGYRKR